MRGIEKIFHILREKRSSGRSFLGWQERQARIPGEAFGGKQLYGAQTPVGKDHREEPVVMLLKSPPSYLCI